MNIRIIRGLLAVALSAAMTASVHAEIHPNNGTFLSYGYIGGSSMNGSVSTVCDNLQFSYKTNYIFVNCGGVGRNGKLLNGASQVPNATGFINEIAAWEAANPGYTFKVLAWIQADITSGDTNFFDATQSINQTTFAAECAKFTNTGTNSYIDGANRAFDGVMVDAEPSGGSGQQLQFNGLKTIMDDVRASMGAGKIAGFAAPKFSATEDSPSWWSPGNYYNMSWAANLIYAMTYNSSSTSNGAYQSWMQAQVSNILPSMSGKYWTPARTTPTLGCELMIGFPACPENPYHNPAYENTTNGGIGVTAGLVGLDTTSLGFFKSAGVYLTSNGTGTDGFASWTGDWLNMQTNWTGNPHLFTDNFNGGSGNWQVDSGTWRIVDKSGTYNYETYASGGGTSEAIVGGSDNWKDYTISVNITPLSLGSGSSVSVFLYENSPTSDRYVASLYPNGTANGTGKIIQVKNGVQTVLATGSLPSAFAVNTTYSVQFIMNENGMLTLLVQGQQVAQVTDTGISQIGTVALSAYNATADFNTVMVTQP